MCVNLKKSDDLEEFNIELYKSRADIIRQTVAQVEKDFGMFGIPVMFTGNTEMAYAEMFSQLNIHISDLLQHNFGKLSALLYQIDLGEDKIVEAGREHSDWGLPEVITELVIHRELKKVLLRNYFKNQKSGE
jgi:hypothetical protein